jgi:cholesterol transport system auxiliary component
MMRAAIGVLLAMLLAGCGGAPAVPDFTWYRMPRPQPLEPHAAPLFDAPVVVEAFGADGLYADQALVYALDPDAQRLRQYHYQLWTDPPTRILQRRLLAQLREARIAATVTDQLPASRPAVRIGGIVLRLDRVPTADGGFAAVVALKLRADGIDGQPLVDDYYRAEVRAADATVQSTVDAYGAALDTIFTRFDADLGTRMEGTHAR